jgi:hypothetical protein
LFLTLLILTVSTILIWQAKDEKETARLQAEKTAIREAEERQRADGNYRQAVEEISALLDRANDPRLSGDQLRQALAERATKFLPGLLAENHPGPGGRFLTGLAYLALGKSHQIRRDVQAAEAYARALAIFQQLMVDFPNDAQFRQQWDRATRSIARQVSSLVHQGDLRVNERKLTEALQTYEIVIAICEKCGAALEPVTRMSAEVNARLNRVRLLWKFGRAKEVENASTATLPVVVQLMNDYPKNVYLAGWATKQAELLIFRGLSRADGGKTGPAAADLREALTLVRRLTPKDRQIMRLMGKVPGPCT